MRPLTEDDVRAAIVNATPDELRVLSVPVEFVLADWDHLDFLAWRDPRTRGRGYIVVEVDGEASRRRAAVVRQARRRPDLPCATCATRCSPPIRSRSSPRARRARPGEHGDSVGTYICADLSCHETVRLAAPLAPSEVRASVDRRIDGTRARVEAFVARVLERGRVRADDGPCRRHRRRPHRRTARRAAACGSSSAEPRSTSPSASPASACPRRSSRWSGDDESGDRIRTYLDDYGVELLATPRPARVVARGLHPQRRGRADVRVQSRRAGTAASASAMRSVPRSADASIVVVSCFPFDDVEQTETLADAARGVDARDRSQPPRRACCHDRERFVARIREPRAGRRAREGRRRRCRAALRRAARRPARAARRPRGRRRARDDSARRSDRSRPEPETVDPSGLGPAGSHRRHHGGG